MPRERFHFVGDCLRRRDNRDNIVQRNVQVYRANAWYKQRYILQDKHSAGHRQCHSIPMDYLVASGSFH